VTTQASGKQQGQDVARGAVDAFLTCEVPAVQMVGGREDARIVASPGVLGRIAVVAPVATARALSDLRGRRIGVVKGSTPHMDWTVWGKELGATEVFLTTEELEEALSSGAVDAVVTWDPWVEDWLRRHEDWDVVASRPFRSALAVGLQWAVADTKRTSALMALVGDALSIAAADRPRWDAEVARMSGWPVGVVSVVADQNAFLSGAATLTPATYAELELAQADRDVLQRAVDFAHAPFGLAALVAPELLRGQVPPPRGPLQGGMPPKAGAPPMSGRPPPMRP
jgi:ABC-type nitrate/sulfonate/bicarbonate transport system substrate-binding protein